VRERQKRNLLATLLLSQGTPMLLAGDEVGHSQGGNNNAYCQDNETTWLAWDAIDADGQCLLEFTRRVIALRHALPVLRRGRFFTGEDHPELDLRDVRWLGPDGTDMAPQQWEEPHARCFGMLLDGRAQATGIRRPAMDATALLVANAHWDVVRFTLPEVIGGRIWRCMLDTNAPERTETPTFTAAVEYEITGRSLVLFVLEPDGETSVALRQADRALLRLEETPAQLPGEAGARGGRAEG
jgi:glycogen operon protein